jgi:hypothetical protein
MEVDRCEQARRSSDRSVITIARPALIGERCAQPPLGSVMFLAQCRHWFLHALFRLPTAVELRLFA